MRKQYPAKIGLLLALALLLFMGGRALAPKNPEKALIDVPFTSQAPQGNWSEPWQNACEETSIYMVSSFYAGDEIKREEAVKRIREILKVKNEKFQVSKDESLETIAALIDELDLPWSARVTYDPTADDLKTELAAGRPVIVPVYAPKLKVPRYEADYHVLVLIGYDDEDGTFITNDPGTRAGEGVRIPQETFMDAIHDLNPEKYVAGKKAVLFTKVDGWDQWLESVTGGEDASSAE